MGPFLEYSEKNHAYYVDGVQYPSVTQVLDAEGFYSEFCKQADAAWRGTEVHRVCAIDDQKGYNLLRLKPEYRGYVRAWRQYRKDSGFAPTLIEERIGHHDPNYAGRFDRIGHRDGRTLPTIIDLKTANGGHVGNFVKYQLAAYAYAYNPRMVIERIAVALMPDGRYRVHQYPMTEYMQDVSMFLQMAKRYQEANNVGQ